MEINYPKGKICPGEICPGKIHPVKTFHGKTYPYDATECKFLLGGIGTGNVSVGTRGNFCDWEIFGQPGKSTYFPYSFGAIWAKNTSAEKPVVKILEAEIHRPYTRSHGFITSDFAGIPRLRRSSISSAYPFVQVDFEDATLPFEASMEAFTPFIPLDTDNSSIPGAVIRYKIKNTTAAPMETTVAFSLANAVGFSGYGLFENMEVSGVGHNEYRQDGAVKGLFYTCPSLEKDDLKNGSMSITTAAPNVTVKEEWLDGAWADGAHDFWEDFSQDGKLTLRSQNDARPGVFDNHAKLRIGTLGICETLAAGEEKLFTFVLTWHFPNRPKSWFADTKKTEVTHNYYAILKKDAWEYAVYLLKHLETLEKSSRDFSNALYSSTLDESVVEALANNITVLRSPTCFRIEDGTFLSWEGGFPTQGSCEGNCTHVWNYAQTAAFLFPELEHSMRKTEFLLETDDNGAMAFRTMKVFDDPCWDMIPAADGQMGTILRLYRDWMLSGDLSLLTLVWEKAAKALDFAFIYWDTDADCVLDSRQHNTYDIEFYGPNSLTNSIFLAALKAGTLMARAMGDTVHEKKYQDAFEKGSRNTDALLWDGEYYIQRIEDVNTYRYQYGTGCLSDQVFGQTLAHISGLGYVLPEEHVKKAILAVYRHNFHETMRGHENLQRTYALNDEGGLLLCSWPHGGRPRLPFVYSDEVWSGVEYHVATHLIFEGFIDEGLTLVKTARNRYNGYDWNPWNEVECGNHYVRSMASWGLLIALSGYRFNLPQNEISFAPVVHQDDFQCFYSNAKSWGIYRQKLDPQTGKLNKTLEVLYGDSAGGVALAEG